MKKFTYIKRGEANARFKKVQDFIVEKFEKRLSTWKRQYLFIGSVILIKSTFYNLLVYYMSLYKMLAGGNGDVRSH